MNYHDIKIDDMNNGTGIRVTLFVSGCEHACPSCHNKDTWSLNSGLRFDESAKRKLFSELSKEHVDGVTFSGGDPLHPRNREIVYQLIEEIHHTFPTKSIWVYTGYSYENLPKDILTHVDVLVDGKFVLELADVNYHWAGSTNQRVIEVQKSLDADKVILFDC